MLRRLLPPVLAVVVTGLIAGPAEARRDDPPVLPPMQVIVLVDESGSLSDEDVLREREAARTIAFSVLAPGSEVSVVGFGSSNGPGQSAVDVVCEPTVLRGEQARASLADCVKSLRKRKAGEGDDTDHAAALQQALSFVRAGDPGHKKIVFLLTDGRLDVANSAAYGDRPDRRNGAAWEVAKQALGDLAAAKAQVWPLGFGSVDQSALSDFARGESCTPAAGDPAARVVSDSSKLIAAVTEAFSSAGCMRILPPDSGDVPGDLHGTIPAIASEAAIIVRKKDRRVQVDYFAPGASEPAPKAGGSNFEFAGQATDLETLKISDPVPGEWTIRLSSAEAAPKDVTATVVYQAAVRAYVTVNPPQPKPGQDVDIEMQVWARNRAITDAAALSTLAFEATMTGAGVGAQKVPLADADRNGTFTGRTTVPTAATGELAFTGQVTGIGIGGDTRVFNTRIRGNGPAIEASILFDVNRASAHPGDEISGRITARNDSGRPARLRLEVVEPSRDTRFSVDPPALQIAPGSSTTPFTLTVGAETVRGTSSATLRLVDDAGSFVVTERLFAAEVTPVPSWPYRHRWLLLGVAVVLAIALALIAMRLWARNETRKVRGLTVSLYVAGRRADDLPAPNPGSKVLRFTVDPDVHGPHLQPAAARDAEAYQIRRAGTGLTFTAPGRPAVPLGLGVRRPVGPDLAVAVVDGADPTTATEVFASTAYDPFDGAAATAPIPGPRDHTATGQYPPPRDPFAPDAHDPFAPDYPAAGSSSPAPSPAGGNTYEDPNNPF
ncbi:vWA domain-containing protein [Paractinoplanes rishiriensis]|uniref:VWFA domain-containing protein n=1 Tax=Paractinoplanes rishiriensis TaxID=1050105 RepID=A0A919N044_9ACTN|nr:vWA domain-containing protein [Actinoplanes rishiriensis]GIE94627.1 hypothetical protein Ari01nite_20920 [Actinoplanes rishiriensis]